MAPTAANRDWPSGPKGKFLTGHLKDFEDDPIGYVGTHLSSYGSTLSLGSGVALTADPDLVRETCRRTNSDFTPRAHTGGPDLAQEIRDAELWMGLRKMGWEHLRRDRVNSFLRTWLEMIEGTAGREVDYIGLRNMTANAAVDLVFGRPDAELAGAACTLIDARERLQMTSFKLPAWLPSRRVRLARSARTAMQSEVERVCKDVESAEVPAEESLSQTILANYRSVGAAREVAEGFLNAHILAATSTPAVSLVWMLHLISTERAAVTDLRGETEGMTNVEIVESTTRGQLPLALAFAHETLRLYPPIWMIPRRAMRPLRAGSLDFEQNAILHYLPFYMHRKAEAWGDDAQDFCPDRWEGGVARTAARHYMPFGAGTRICPGLQTGVAQLASAAALIASRYEVTSNLASATPRPQPMLLPEGKAVFELRPRVPRGSH